MKSVFACLLRIVSSSICDNGCNTRMSRTCQCVAKECIFLWGTKTVVLKQDWSIARAKRWKCLWQINDGATGTSCTFDVMAPNCALDRKWFCSVPIQIPEAIWRHIHFRYSGWVSLQMTRNDDTTDHNKILMCCLSFETFASIHVA